MNLPPLPEVELPKLPPMPEEGYSGLAMWEYAVAYAEKFALIYGKSCARMAREEAAKERRDLEEVLATIAAQSSGIPVSTSRADCMAALAAAALRKG